MSQVVVRIESNDQNEIVVKRIQYSRFEFFGCGSFVWKIKPEEISISQKAFDLLRRRVGYEYTSLGDLAGLDLSFSDTQVNINHRGFSLNYGYLGPQLSIPLEDVLIDQKFYEILRQVTKTEETLDLDPEDKKRWDDLIQLDQQQKTEEVEAVVSQYYKTKTSD